MKYRGFIIGAILCCCCACSHTIYVPVQSKHKEEIIYRDTVIEWAAHDTLLQVVTSDTTSTLVTPLAESTATVSKGILSHTLTILPKQDSVRIVWAERHITDSIPYCVPIHSAEPIEIIPGWMWWIVMAAIGVIAIELTRIIERWKRK